VQVRQTAIESRQLPFAASCELSKVGICYLSVTDHATDLYIGERDTVGPELVAVRTLPAGWPLAHRFDTGGSSVSACSRAGDPHPGGACAGEPSPRVGLGPLEGPKVVAVAPGPCENRSCFAGLGALSS
jgi:hypothetical protein